MKPYIEPSRSKDLIDRKVRGAHRPPPGSHEKVYLQSPVDYQYFNMSLYNAPGDSVPILQAFYEQSFPTPFINSPTEYHLSVERFKIPTSLIPLFVWPDAVYPPGVDYTTITTATYWVSLRYVNPTTSTDQVFSVPVFYTTPAVYSPTWTGQITTFPSFYDVDGETRYGIWKILDFLELVYRSLQLAFAALIAAFPASTPALFPGLGPLVGYTYEVANNISFDMPISFSEYTGFPPPAPPLHTDHVRVYFNSPLASFFPNVRSSFYSYSENFLPSLDYELQIRPTYLTTILGFQYIGNPQELSTYEQWNDLIGIVFTTNNIPVNPEATSTPLSGPGSSGAGSNILFAVSDFEPLTFEYPYKYITFNQIGPRRYVDLRSDVAISRIDIQAYWQSKRGDLFPIYLAPTDVFTMKLLFHRKGMIESGEK